MSSVTERPWDCDCTYSSGASIPLAKSREVIAIMGKAGDVAYVSNTLEKEEQKEVATLLAASPDLLAACRAAEWAECDTPWWRCPICSARRGEEGHEPDCVLANAIAKATIPRPQEPSRA